MAQQAREIFENDGLAKIVTGGEETLEDVVIPMMIEGYPAAVLARPGENYTFAQMAHEFSEKVTGVLVGSALQGTRRVMTGQCKNG